jgi:hypothetical protein
MGIPARLFCCDSHVGQKCPTDVATLRIAQTLIIFIANSRNSLESSIVPQNAPRTPICKPMTFFSDSHLPGIVSSRKLEHVEPSLEFRPLMVSFPVNSSHHSNNKVLATIFDDGLKALEHPIQRPEGVINAIRNHGFHHGRTPV